MSFLVVIPARHASTRLPGKMLLDLAGKPMVVRVAQRARQSAAREVIVATDHADIEAAVARHGVRAVLTAAEHASGTDRIAEVAASLALADDDIVVNVQGDEPLIDPELVNGVAQTLASCPDASIATAARPMSRGDDFRNPNFVKIVRDAAGCALYFSRAPIPFVRDGNKVDEHALPAGLDALHHIGIYAYRAGFLRIFGGLAQSPAERFEALEQLRALHHGYRIMVRVWEGAVEAGVDTAADLERVRAHFAAQS